MEIRGQPRNQFKTCFLPHPLVLHVTTSGLWPSYPDVTFFGFTFVLLQLHAKVLYLLLLKSRRPFRCLLPRRGFHLDSLPLNSGWWRAAVMVDLLEPIPICTQNLWRSAKVITGFLSWNFYTQIVQFVPTNSSETSPSWFKLLPFRSVGRRCAPRNLQESQNQTNFPTSVPLKFDLWALVEGLISHFGLWWRCQQWDLLQVCVFKKSRLISWTHHSCNVPAKGRTICAKAIFQVFFFLN